VADTVERNPTRRLLKTKEQANRHIRESAKTVSDIYEAARTRIMALIVEQSQTYPLAPWSGPNLVRLSEALQREYADLEARVRAELKYSLPFVAQSYYLMGLQDIVGGKGAASALGRMDMSRVNNALQDSYAHVAGATKRMSDTHVSYLRQLSAKVFRQTSLTGETRKEVSKQLLSDALKVPGFQFIDKAGSTWSLDNYFDMLARTSLMNAGRQSYYDACASEGYDIVRVTVSGAPCPACAVWENRLLSISGNTPGLPTVDQATAKGLFHPSCTHSVVAVHAKDAARKFDAEGRPLTGYKPPALGEGDSKEAWRKHRTERNASKKAEQEPKSGNDSRKGWNSSRGQGTVDEKRTETKAVILKPEEIKNGSASQNSAESAIGALKDGFSVKTPMGEVRFDDSLIDKYVSGKNEQDRLRHLARAVLAVRDPDEVIEQVVNNNFTQRLYIKTLPKEKGQRRMMTTVFDYRVGEESRIGGLIYEKLGSRIKHYQAQGRSVYKK